MSYLPEGNVIQELWLIVEWKTSKNKHSGYTLVSSEDLANNFSLQDLHTGKVVKIKSGKKVRKASIVIVSADRGFLEMEIKLLQEAAQQIGLLKKPIITKENNLPPAGSTNAPEVNPEEHSDSDWHPDSSDSESENEEKNLKRSISKGNRSWRNSSKPHHQVKQNSKQLNQYSNPKENHPTDKTYRHGIPGIADFISAPRRPSANVPHSPGQFVIDMGSYASERNEEVSESPSHLNNFKERQKVFQHLRNDVEINRTIKLSVPPMTFDQQTQTKLSNGDSVNIELLCENHNQLTAEVAYLHKTVNDLRNQMESMQRTMVEMSHFGRQSTPVMNVDTETITHMEYIDNMEVMEEGVNGNNIVLREMNNRHSTDRIVNTSVKTDVQPYTTYVQGFQNDETLRDQPTPCPSIHRNSESDMIAIGSGTTLIPRHIFRQINWNSYSHATRKLLMAVFPRRTLATHSLTGKSSPAFTNKPAKMQLDVKKITDIIVTVTEMSKVQENLVRNIITTKCADENKMYRMRMEKMKTKKSREFDGNQENQFP